jgi:putative tryptophan/tyrosine transport system substrate-binding protein
MRRRAFITLLGGAAAAPAMLWPLAARAQTGERGRRLGMLMSLAESDPEGQARASAFRQGLKELGWTESRNIRIEYRFATGSAERMRPYAAELVGLEPEVIFVGGTVALTVMQAATRKVPIVFTQVTDPVEAGFVASLARPGGNITGLTQHEFGIGVKWLELLKQIAPRVTRVAVIYDPANPAAAGYLRTIEPAAPSFDTQVSASAVRDAAEIARAIDGFAAEPNGGLVVLPGAAAAVNRDQIIALADRHRLPAVYAFRYHVVSGGLASYGIDNIDLYKRAAWYVDRILKGEKPGELPVQHASKFQLVINLKTAKALGLDVPLSLLARTDEVIE